MSKKNVRVIPYDGPRVETGAVQFGAQDWPGLFIRGDNAMGLLGTIDALKDRLTDNHSAAASDPQIRFLLDQLDVYAKLMRQEVV